MTATAAPARTRLGAKRLDSWRAAWQNKGAEGVRTERSGEVVASNANNEIRSIPRAALPPLCSPSASDHDAQRGALLRPGAGESEGWCVVSDRRSWLYLLQAGEMFKIGITGSSVCGRIKQLQTGCPHKINLVCAVRLEEADGAEKELHHRLKGVREQGEWFRLNPLSITRLIATMGSFVGAQVWERSKGTATVEMPEVDVDGDWLIDYIDASVMAWARFNLSSEGDKS